MNIVISRPYDPLHKSTHTQIHVHTHRCMYTHTDTCTYTDVCTHAQMLVHTQMYVYTHSHTRLCALVSYLNDTKPQPTKGIINRHRIIFQFLVSREISPYHCLERKFYRKQRQRTQVLINAMTCWMVCDLSSQPSNLSKINNSLN